MYDVNKQLARVKRKYNDPMVTDEQILDELEYAMDTINERRHFTPTEEIPLEVKYYSLQVELTVQALAKYGAEGEKSHSDNGVNRVYDNSSSYSEASLNKIIPLARSL